MAAVVGRAERVAWGRELIDTGRSIAIWGPPGMGKTTLARAIADECDRPVLWTSVTRSSASIAFGPIAPLLAEAGVETTVPHQVLGSLGRALQETHARPVVVVDDAHLLDDGSAAVIHGLAAAGIPVMITARAEVPVPDAVRALWSDGLAERVDLQPFDLEGVVAQLDSMLGAVAAETAERIFELSNGNPLYVREIVLSGRADGWLQLEAGQWRAAGGPPPSGARLRELIASRLLDCPPEQLEALEVVAVAEQIELVALREMVGDEVILALEDRQLLRVTMRQAVSTVAIDHQIIGEVVRADLGEVRRQLHADRVVTALRSLPAPTTDRLLRLGALSAQSSAPDPAVLLDATAAAHAVHDFGAAAELARLAAAHGGGIDAELAWAGAAAAASDYEEAERVIRRAVSSPGLTSRQRARALSTLATVLLWGLGRADEAEATLRDADVDDEGRRRLDADLGFLALNRGDVDRAIATCEPLLDDEVPEIRLRAATTVAASFALKGHPRTVDRVVDAHLDDATEHALAAPRAVAELLAAQVMVHHLSGTPVTMVEGARALLDMAEQAADRELEAVGSHLLAVARLAQGHVEEARVAADRALELFSGHDTARLSGWAHAVRAHVAGHLGDLAAVEHHLARSVDVPYGAFRSYDFDRTLARSRAAASRGERRVAIDAALGTAEEMQAAGRDAAEAILVHLATRLGHRGTTARLVELAARAEGTLLPAIADHVCALEAVDADALLACADRFEQMGDDLAAADAAADAARAAWAADRRSTAAAAASRARQLLERCGGAVLAQPLPVPDLHLDLTDRELEIAVLAASGHTNKEIADRLYLSARTVGNHLYRAYAKAGVEGRAELAEVLRTAGHLR